MKRFIKPPGHEKCSWSSGIHDGPTVGSGKLDDYGYWEFPCYVCARENEKQFPEQGDIWPFSLDKKL